VSERLDDLTHSRGYLYLSEIDLEIWAALKELGEGVSL
jgi:hypothetical protein